MTLSAELSRVCQMPLSEEAVYPSGADMNGTGSSDPENCVQ
jgi:hypothetical protein